MNWRTLVKHMRALGLLKIGTHISSLHRLRFQSLSLASLQALFQEGPSTQCLRTLVPKTINKGHGFWAQRS